MNRLVISAALLAAFLMLLATTAHGSGFVIVEGYDSNYPIRVESISISAQVSGLAAKVRVEQVLLNTTNRDIEGTFLFPVPESSTFTSFAMSVGDQTVEGELTEAGKAEEIYRRIVSRLKDPGLLQFLGCGLYRFNIYPIPASGKKTISFEYVVPLEKRGDAALLTIPLKSSALFKKPIGTFAFTADVEMPCCIANISSAAYNIGVLYKGDNSATVTLARTNVIPERDLDILIQTAETALSSALITCEGEDGNYFCIEISPGRVFRPDSIQPKDVTYIVDVSGSMSGAKLEAAKEALLRCAALLNPSDQFRLVVFEDEARFVVSEFEQVCQEALCRFGENVKGIHAGGGTNMEAGIRLGLPICEIGKLHYVILISDGQPNIGLSGERELADLIRELAAPQTRLFTLGVGEDINLFLLDQLAIAGGGFSDYIPEHSFVAERIAEFAAKINFPVLEDVQFSIEGPRVWHLAPEKLTTLFAGTPIRLFGRFDHNLPMRLTLTGMLLGREEVLTFDFDPIRDGLPSPYLPVLWASRRVAALLDRMRLEDTPDLKEEVTALAIRYGIVTPFTSFLVSENGRVPQDVDAFLRWWNSTRGGSVNTGSAQSGSGIGTVVSGTSSYNKFFGREITANRILFVLDISGSMSEPCGEKGANAKLSKFERAREELKRVIKTLDTRSFFNIVVFNQEARLWQKTLIPASAANCAEAIKFLDSLSPSGETHMIKAFEKAFEFADAEAIYFVSDGAPYEKGAPADPKKVLEKVNFLNRFQKAEVNTVGFEGADMEFMQSLARAHDGVFRYVGDMKVEPLKRCAPSADPLSKFPDTPEIQAVRKLLKHFSQSALDKMLKLAIATSDPNTFQAVKSALCSLDTSSQRQIVCSAITKKKDYRARVLLADVIGTYLQFPPAVDSLIEAGLRERALPALRAEVLALSQFRDKKTVTGLAKIWRAFEDYEEAKWIVDKVKRALEAIIGVSGVTSAEDFLKWWEIAQASFQLPQTAGSAGIRGQQYLGQMRRAETAESASISNKIISVEGKTFVLNGDTWIDTTYRDDMPVTEVLFLSTEYWQLAADAKWAKYLSIAPRVLVCLDGKAVRIKLADRTK